MLELKQEGNFQYIEEGEGPVIVLVHGLFGALSNWENVINFFKQDYRVVVPQLPLFTLPLLKTNVQGLSDYLHEFITYKKYDKVTLIGNSLGGHVALVYVLDHPEKVFSMVLTGSSGLYENAMGGSMPKRQDYEFIKKKTEYTFFDPNIATKELVDEVYEIVNSRIKGIKIIAMAKSAIRHNLASEIKNIHVPVCLIWGLNDTITPPEVADEFLQILENAELHWIDKCGHAPMMEVPDQFNEILSGFLKKVHSNQIA
jgi:pimeloyl-ACP methyl ester carboxylesterase